MTRRAVTLYGRPGCHLCELMVEELEPLCRAAGRDLQVVDVDAAPAWRARYGARIPVACLGTEELSGWPMQVAEVSRRLRAPDDDMAPDPEQEPRPR